uniref:Uncharacterized protein n=1 Tax=Oryza brachyantha TaxID=4533 RepID=J3LW02_ORYBR
MFLCLSYEKIVHVPTHKTCRFEATVMPLHHIHYFMLTQTNISQFHCIFLLGIANLTVRPQERHLILCCQRMTMLGLKLHNKPIASLLIKFD